MQCKNCKNKLSDLCLTCKRNINYKDNFEPMKIEEGKCMCIYCKGIFDIKGDIFVKKSDPKKGICFNCY